MTDRELMQMALEELEELADVGYGSKTVLQALRDRLAQSEPPEVMWLTFHEPPMVFRNRDDALAFCQDGEQPIPMYSSPPKREWVGLTDGEMVDLLKECEGRLWADGFRAIEAKLKEKNT